MARSTLQVLEMLEQSMRRLGKNLGMLGLGVVVTGLTLWWMGTLY